MTILQLLTSAVAAATITLAVTGIVAHLRHRRRSRGYAEGILLETWISERYAKAYLESTGEEKNFWAPAYRVPLDFAEPGIAHLMGTGLLKADALKYCIDWLLAAREFNRCLEFVSAAAQREGGDDAARHYGQKETGRLQIKSKNLIAASDNAGAVMGTVLRSWRVRRLATEPEAP